MGNPRKTGFGGLKRCGSRSGTGGKAAFSRCFRSIIREFSHSPKAEPGFWGPKSWELGKSHPKLDVCSGKAGILSLAEVGLSPSGIHQSPFPELGNAGIPAFLTACSPPAPNSSSLTPQFPLPPSSQTEPQPLGNAGSPHPGFPPFQRP